MEAGQAGIKRGLWEASGVAKRKEGHRAALAYRGKFYELLVKKIKQLS
jgi:hypothetical protein